MVGGMGLRVERGVLVLRGRVEETMGIALEVKRPLAIESSRCESRKMRRVRIGDEEVKDNQANGASTVDGCERHARSRVAPCSFFYPAK